MRQVISMRSPNLERNGAKTNGNTITLPSQKIQAVRFEKSFDGHYPVLKTPVIWSANKDEVSFDFDGIGFVIRGNAASNRDVHTDYVYNTELYVDDKLVEKPKLPVDFTTRRYELAWKYQLPKGKHTVKLKVLNPSKEYELRGVEAIVYSDQPVDGMKQTMDAAKSKQ